MALALDIHTDHISGIITQQRKPGIKLFLASIPQQILKFDDIFSIDKIEDMVKIADEIGQTVFYYKADDEAERKIEFYVFDEGRIYYMVLFGSL